MAKGGSNPKGGSAAKTAYQGTSSGGKTQTFGTFKPQKSVKR